MTDATDHRRTRTGGSPFARGSSGRARAVVHRTSDPLTQVAERGGGLRTPSSRGTRPPPAAPPAVSVLLLDPRPLVRATLRIVLGARAGFAVTDADDVDSAVAVCARWPTQVAVVDPWYGADADGLRAVRLITSCGVRVVVFTGRCSRSSVLEAVRAGAASYVVNDVGSDALRRAVAGTAAGRDVMSARARSVCAIGGERPLFLTRPELEVLRVLADGWSNGEIARRLHVAEGTVESHLAHMLAKAYAASPIELVAIARARGHLS